MEMSAEMFQAQWQALQAQWAQLQGVWGALQALSGPSPETLAVMSSAQLPAFQAQLGALLATWEAMSQERFLEEAQALLQAMESELAVLQALLAQ